VLVTCEGIDGSGKSTAARALVDALRARGHDARLHAEPTRSWLGEAVRRGFAEPIDPWSEALLFMADHATHVRDVRRELAEGATAATGGSEDPDARLHALRIVVSDRWSDSTFAYQGAALEDIVASWGPGAEGRDAVVPPPRGPRPSALALLQQMERPFDLAPDLTLLFDIDVDEALRRVGARGGASEKFERRDFLDRVRRNYLALAKAEPRRFVTLDAARAPDAVLRDALAAVLGRTSSKQS
jgi:dTMP kinase